MASIGFGAAAVIIGTFGAYAMYQGSAEREYANEVNAISTDLNRITGGLMADLLPKLESRAIAMAEAKSVLASLVNDAEKLHQHALKINVPDKYKGAHPHLVQGLDYFSSAMKSGMTTFQYTDDALQASEQLESSASTKIVGAIFGFGSLPDLAGRSDVQSDIEAARAAYNDAIRYYGHAEEELNNFYSLSKLPPSTQPDQQTRTQEQLQLCKELGIPEFTCNDVQILTKKKLLSAGQQDTKGAETNTP